MSEPIRINLGSGQRPFGPGWINYDTQSRWNPDICDDGANMPKHFAENSVETIVLHHVLEHFGCGEAAGLIDACCSVLAPGGSLIVCVPDLQQLIRGYITQKIDEQVFKTNLYGAYMGDPADRHAWAYSARTLTEFLQGDRPWDVRQFDWREIPGSAIARDWWILAQECVKSEHVVTVGVE